jgi:hypothetical protein
LLPDRREEPVLLHRGPRLECHGHVFLFFLFFLNRTRRLKRQRRRWWW